MTFRFIGSKARLTTPIAEAIDELAMEPGRFIDAFCGTGAVSEVAAGLGWDVWANDALESATTMTAARLVSIDEVQMKSLGGYARAIERLNSISPMEGTMWKLYSPASARIDPHGTERRYFTEANASMIDAARIQIARWAADGMLTKTETNLLLGDLISAANRVANIAGTYGCFLSRWQASSQKRLEIAPRKLKDTPTKLHSTNSDASEIAPDSSDLVYIDPPYTKRQYASYYHILETIVLGDEPAVEGVSGLRPWKHKASDYCYKRKALGALTNLVARMSARRVLISYSSEGHVDLSELLASLEKTGEIRCKPVRGVGRYRPNQMASANGDSVTEYLISYLRYVEESDGEQLARECVSDGGF